VGAALLGADHRVLALGYNGAPSGTPGCLSSGACPHGQFTYADIAHGLGDTHPVPCIALHAERNCLEHFKRGRPESEWAVEIFGATLYITDEPCLTCALYVGRHPGLARVVTPHGSTPL
jgi:dCMP deaminase